MTCLAVAVRIVWKSQCISEDLKCTGTVTGRSCGHGLLFLPISGLGQWWPRCHLVLIEFGRLFEALLQLPIVKSLPYAGALF